MRRLAAAARTVRDMWRFAKASTPSCLMVLPAENMAIPTPIDGTAILAATLVRLARSRQARAELAALVSAGLGRAK